MNRTEYSAQTGGGARREAGGGAIGNWHRLDVDPDRRWAGLQWRRFGEHGTAALIGSWCRFWPFSSHFSSFICLCQFYRTFGKISSKMILPMKLNEKARKIKLHLPFSLYLSQPIKWFSNIISRFA